MEQTELANIGETIIGAIFSRPGNELKLLNCANIMLAVNEQMKKQSIPPTVIAELKENMENGNIYGSIVFSCEEKKYSPIPISRNGIVYGKNAYDIPPFGYFRNKELFQYIMDNKEKVSDWTQEDFAAGLKKKYMASGSGMEVLIGQDPVAPTDSWIFIRKRGATSFTNNNCYGRKLFRDGKMMNIMFVGDVYSPISNFMVINQ